MRRQVARRTVNEQRSVGGPEAGRTVYVHPRRTEWARDRPVEEAEPREQLT
jgi:hypothetical protein